MHEYTHDHIYSYIKENYDPKTMSCQDLKELGELADIAKDLLTSDYYYHVVKAMEEGGNTTASPMSTDEFMVRFKKMYTSATPSEQSKMKTDIAKVITQ